MTREAARARQANVEPPAVRMVRCVVTTVGTHTVTVTLPSGASVVGVRVAGCTYTVSGAGFVLIQEPAVGPVFPTA